MMYFDTFVKQIIICKPINIIKKSPVRRIFIWKNEVKYCIDYNGVM